MKTTEQSKCFLGALALMIVLGAPPAFAATIKHTYDAAGRLVATDYGGGKVTVYSYDANGNLLNRATSVATNADVRFSSSSSTVVGTAAGGAVTYSFTITNAGPHAATAVTFTDPLPFGILPTGVSVGQGVATMDGRLITANLGVLSPGGSSVTVTITGIRAFIGSFTNIATVTSAVADPNLANNTATLTVSATTPALDADGDGMPNWWETLRGLSAFTGVGDNGANGDPDADSIRNFDEWVADTDPRDANSFFHVEDLSLGPEGVSLMFQSSPIRRYISLSTDSLDAPFTGFSTNNGTGALMTITDMIPQTGTRFYLLEVQLP